MSNFYIMGYPFTKMFTEYVLIYVYMFRLKRGRKILMTDHKIKIQVYRKLNHLKGGFSKA